MSSNAQAESRFKEIVLNNWVAWVIEALLLGVVSAYTIYETRKTAEQTRDMLQRFESSVSNFAQKKSSNIDSAVDSTTESLLDSMRRRIEGRVDEQQKDK